MPRGRPKRGSNVATEKQTKKVSESENNGTRSSRRSRLPKRYLDEDYVPTPPKKRAIEVSNEETQIAAQTTSTASSTSSRPKGRPRKADKKPQKKKKEKEPWEEEAEEEYLADYDSEHVSDEDFPSPSHCNDDPEEEEEEEEEELILDNIKTEIIDEEPGCSIPWIDMDPASIPKLELPETSQDIPLPHSAIFDAIEIFEILRSYHRTLRLTPFNFEDFCGALLSNTNSCLISEIHICLLRICLKSDDEEQTHYSVNETNNAINIMIHHMDTFTYSEILRMYIQAYPGVDSSVRDAVNTENYPFTGYEEKIIVLLFMCYRFLYSAEYKKIVANTGKFQNDDSCRVCGKIGKNLVGCTQCEASFHQDCSALDPFPEVLICNLCTQNNVRGVADSLPFDETHDKEPLRMKPLGKDRHGRFYWFIARRIFVQSDDDSEFRYYTTAPQLYQLVQSLDEKYYEKELCEVLKQRMDMILEQMTLTLEMALTKWDISRQNFIKDHPTSELFNFPVLYIHQDNFQRLSVILQSCEKEVKHELKEEAMDEDEKESAEKNGAFELKKEESRVLLKELEGLIGIYNGHLTNAYWCGGATEAELEYYYYNKTDDTNPEEQWRLGDVKNDTSFTDYVNYYTKSEMSDSFLVRKKVVDRKKYMATRFCFSEIPKYIFEWSQGKDLSLHSDTRQCEKILRLTIIRLINNIPIEMMHRRWPEHIKIFEDELNRAASYKDFAVCMMKLDCVIRKTVFVQQWWSGIGQLKFERSTVEQRELQSKEFQKQKRLEMEALAKELDESYIRVNYTTTKFPNTYILRQKGESYRNAGKGAMGGWLWVSSKFSRNSDEVASLPELPILDSNGKLVERKNESISNKKARRLEKVMIRLKKRKSDKNQEKEFSEFSMSSSFVIQNLCYSPNCLQNRIPSLICQDTNNDVGQICYSANCRLRFLERCAEQKNSVKNKKETVGEEIAWPIPKPHDFSSNGVRNIFVVEKKILRKLVHGAGCKSMYIPGFANLAKSNHAIWNYPAPRPCLDLCWRWMMVNSHSLQAVALLLKVMWTSIRWHEMEPDDDHPDRRVVTDFPTHDERRRIVLHKELGPFGQYERYYLEIEIIPLHNDDNDDDDEAWSAKKERDGSIPQRISTRRRRNGKDFVRKPKAIKHEWIDGVELKVFEIRDYWGARRKCIEQNKTTERKDEHLETVEQYQQKIQQRPPRPPMYSSVPRMTQVWSTKGGRTVASYQASTPARLSTGCTPVMTRPRPSPANEYLKNGGRTVGQQLWSERKAQVEKFNLSSNSNKPDTPQLPSSSGSSQLTPSYSQRPTQRFLATTFPSRSSPSTDYRYQQVPSTSRAAAGSEIGSSRRTGEVYPMAGTCRPRTDSVPMRMYSNGYTYPDGQIRGGGRSAQYYQSGQDRSQQPAQLSQQTTSQQQQYPKNQNFVPKRVVLVKSVGDRNIEMRRNLVDVMRRSGEPVAEEAVSANASDGDELPPVIPRYDRTGTNIADQGDQPRQPVRHVYTATAPVTGRRIPNKNALIVVKRSDGSPNMIVRPQSSGNSMTPGTVIMQQGNRKVISVQPGTQYLTNNGTKVVRVAQRVINPADGTGRVIVPTNRSLTDYEDGVPRQYVVNRNLIQQARVIPRGGSTMQMAQQQQNPQVTNSEVKDQYDGEQLPENIIETDPPQN